MERFFKKKVVKIYLPCLIFISFAYLLWDSDAKLTGRFLLSLLTCTFNGQGSGISYIGASWYVFVLMWLFLLTPLFNWLLNCWERRCKGREYKGYLLLLCVVIAIGLAYRVVGRWLGLEWYSYIYASVAGGCDLFLSGMIACRLSSFLPSSFKRRRNVTARFAWILLAALILLCCFFYFYGEYDEDKYSFLVSVYKYVTPSFYIAIACLLLMTSVIPTNTHKENVGIGKIAGTITPYTFEFYLWHSIIYASIAGKLHIQDNFLHFTAVLVIGTLTTGYVALLMTKMNKEISKSFHL